MGVLGSAKYSAEGFKIWPNMVQRWLREPKIFKGTKRFKETRDIRALRSLSGPRI